MPEKSSLRFQMSVVWNCGFKRLQSDYLPPFILHSSSAYHEMCRLALSQKHAAASWVRCEYHIYLLDTNPLCGLNLHYYTLWALCILGGGKKEKEAFSSCSQM